MTHAVHLRSAVAVAGRFPALAGVDFTSDPGEVVAIFGPNGAGKTSLLRLLAGLLPLVSGTGVVGDIDMARDAEELKFVAGYLGHGSYFYDELTCVDNMTFFLKALRKDASGARGALEQCGIGGRLHKTPFGKLSAGQKKRVGLAYLVARAPSLWLLDEPHTSLDQSGRALLEEIVAHEKKAGSCVLFSSHEQDVALPLADRGVVMGGGIIVEELDHKETSTLSLLSESGDAHVA